MDADKIRSDTAPKPRAVVTVAVAGIAVLMFIGCRNEDAERERALADAERVRWKLAE